MLLELEDALHHWKNELAISGLENDAVMKPDFDLVGRRRSVEILKVSCSN